MDKLNDKILTIKDALIELAVGAANESKSSAGDKHETGRAMVQLEQEKLGNQLYELEGQKAILDKLDATITYNVITKGSLVKTDKGTFYLSIPLGKICVDDIQIMVLSPQSPLGFKFLGLKAENIVEMNGLNYLVLGVS